MIFQIFNLNEVPVNLRMSYEVVSEQCGNSPYIWFRSMYLSMYSYRYCVGILNPYTEKGANRIDGLRVYGHANINVLCKI